MEIIETKTQTEHSQCFGCSQPTISKVLHKKDEHRAENMMRVSYVKENERWKHKISKKLSIPSLEMLECGMCQSLPWFWRRRLDNVWLRCIRLTFRLLIPGFAVGRQGMYGIKIQEGAWWEKWRWSWYMDFYSAVWDFGELSWLCTVGLCLSELQLTEYIRMPDLCCHVQFSCS